MTKVKTRRVRIVKGEYCTRQFNKKRFVKDRLKGLAFSKKEEGMECRCDNLVEMID